MQWQYYTQKAELEHKAQIYAKFHKRLHNSFCTMVWKQKHDALPPDPATYPKDGQPFFPLTTIPDGNSCRG